MRLAALVAIAVLATAGGVARPDPSEEPPPRRQLAPRANIERIEHKPAGEAPSVGPSTAPVTVELFFVPGQSPTKGPYEQLRKLQAAHPSRIRLVFRVLQRGSNLLSPVAALEASAQGKFDEFMTALLKKSNARREQLLDLARQVGLDTARLEQAWDDGRHDAELSDNDARWRRLHKRNMAPDAAFNSQILARPVVSLDYDELESLYQDAYDQSLDRLDRGVPLAHLTDAFDRDALTDRPATPLAPGPIDDPDPDAPTDDAGALLAAPLDTRGWPSTGPADARVEVVVLCNLRSVNCRNQIVDKALPVATTFDEVRIVWGPMFDPSADDATATTMVNDAALCAEELGAGWTWVEQAAQAAYRRHGKPADPDKEIDDAIAATDLDSAAMSHCLASSAGASARAVERIRAAGVKAGPALVVGGRVYPGGVGDPRMLQGLVEDELAPGLLEDLVPDWSDRP